MANDDTNQPESDSSPVPGRSTTSRFVVLGVVVSISLALVVVGIFRWRRESTAVPTDTSSAIPFRPRVTYDSTGFSVTNTEAESYLDASLNVYIGAIPYKLQIGTILPGETIRRNLRDLTNERGESFNPGTPGTSQLEVRARFGGYDVHKDFPPPP